MDRSILVVRFVAWWTAQNSARHNVVQHPRHVVARVRLRQQVRDGNVVSSARQRVNSKQLQSRNIGQNLQSTVSQGVVHYLASSQLLLPVVRCVYVAE